MTRREERRNGGREGREGDGTGRVRDEKKRVEGVELREEDAGSAKGFKRTLSARGDEPTHDLELDGLALEVNGTDLEVDTNGRDVALGVGVVGESEEQTGLADTRVTDEEKLRGC